MATASVMTRVTTSLWVMPSTVVRTAETVLAAMSD